MVEQIPPEQVEPVKPKPYRMRFKIETPRGMYEIARPVGRFGAIHFSLLSRCMPDQYDQEGKPLYKGNVKKDISEVYEEWASKLLKHLIISGPPIDGQPFTYERMPGEDQFAIFMLISQETDVTLSSFRIVE
jgi:hypothetical protein